MPRLLRLLASSALVLAVCAAGGTSASAQAQGPQPGSRVGVENQTGRLLVTLVDATGAVLPGATVTLGGVDDRTRAATHAPVQSSPQGVATMGDLALGRYTIQAEFPGFQAATLANVTVRAGDNKHVIVLAIQKQQDSVTVAQDRQAAAADPAGRPLGRR